MILCIGGSYVELWRTDHPAIRCYITSCEDFTTVFNISTNGDSLVASYSCLKDQLSSDSVSSRCVVLRMERSSLISSNGTCSKDLIKNVSTALLEALFVLYDVLDSICKEYRCTPSMSPHCSSRGNKLPSNQANIIGTRHTCS